MRRSFGTAAVLGLSVLASCIDSGDPVGLRAPGAPLNSLTNLNSLTLVGGAAVQGDWVRLSGGGTTRIGGAWLPNRESVGESFTTDFEFRVTAAPGSNDGFAFVIQSQAADALGTQPFGYSGISPSVAVAFDTRGSGSKLIVLSGGSLGIPLGSANLTRPINDGQVQTARIAYEQGSLEIALNGVVVLTLSLDLASFPGLLDADGKAWVGFTASSQNRNGQPHDIGGWTFGDPDGPLPLKVTVVGPSPLPNVTSVVTNTETGDFFVGTTDQNGEANFLLPPGNYIASAYRFKIQNWQDLVVWPSNIQDETDASLPGFPPVIWYPIDVSLVKTPENLLLALDNPLVIELGGIRDITLEFGSGATLQCVLLDPDGNPLAPDDDSRIFGIIPVPNSPKLPNWTPPSGFPWTVAQLRALPRGIGFGTAFLPAGVAGGCEIPGATPGKVVLESPPISKNGKTFVYRASRSVGNSGDFATFAGPSPELVVTNWHHDETIGDAADPINPRDFGGAIVFGWTKGDPLPDGYFNPTDTFVVSSQFMGNGTYTVEIWEGPPGNKRPDVTITASCSASKCSAASSSVPRNKGITVAVEGVSAPGAGEDFGTVVWSVDWPGLTTATMGPDGPIAGTGTVLYFQIFSGSKTNPGDTLAPNATYLSAEKSPGRAQSYLLGGMM